MEAMLKTGGGVIVNNASVARRASSPPARGHQSTKLEGTMAMVSAQRSAGLSLEVVG